MEVLNKNRTLIKDRIMALIKALSNGIYERESTIKLCLLAALSGESVFLLGPPGIAKSLIAKRLIEAFDQSSFFDYLMTRFSTPEEVFGPLSIQDLKDNGDYIRLTKGYLPTADIVFLDEIWKSGPAILNTLLTVINERTFKNGQHVTPIPMRLLITASNELPEADSGLEALYDRMLVRVYIDRIKEKNNFKAMLTGDGAMIKVSPDLTIKNTEFELWQGEINNVKLSDEIFDKIYQLKQQIEKDESTDNATNNMYVSDRRWKKSIRLLKASAYFNARNEINPLDLLILKDCLWSDMASLETVNNIVENFATSIAFDQKPSENYIIQSDLALSEANTLMLKALSTSVDLGRKDTFRLDIDKAKRFTINNNSNMIKLVLLQVNPSVSDVQQGDAEWVYVDGQDLSKKIHKGKCEIYGYINRYLKVSPLQFEVDAKQNLVIKDVTQRNINTSIVQTNNNSLADHQDWINNVESANTYLDQANQTINQSRIQFHSALPHTFVDENLSLHIDKSFQENIAKIDKLKADIALSSQRIMNMDKYFE